MILLRVVLIYLIISALILVLANGKYNAIGLLEKMYEDEDVPKWFFVAVMIFMFLVLPIYIPLFMIFVYNKKNR